MNKRIRPIQKTAAIEERKFWHDPRSYRELMEGTKRHGPGRVGPETYAIEYPELPKACRVAVIHFFFLDGNSAQIWPEGNESEKVDLGPESGELDMPVGPTRRWIVYLAPNVRMITALVDAR